VAQVTPHQWATIMRWSTAFSEAKREMWPAYSSLNHDFWSAFFNFGMKFLIGTAESGLDWSLG
jgi:hypothetical protein